MKLIVLTTTYNCQDYIEKCLATIMTQTHKDFRCFITDDMSTDQTVNKIKNFIKEDDRFILIENENKMYQPGNYDQVIRGNYGVEDDDICIEVDGDDWLPDSKVFERVVNHYSDTNVWLANGSFKYHDGRMGFAQPYTSFDNIRNEAFTLTHLRTWKVFLWRKINQDDLKNDDGEYWSVAGDLSFMYPMAEMSGIEHYKFMSEINYTYNEGNPLNDHKVNMQKVTEIVNKIRGYKPYKRLDEKKINFEKKTPLELVTPYRFDLIIKYLYADSIIKNYKTDFFKSIYKEHLRIWNGFKEYDNPNKNTFESFDKEFKLIIESLKKTGFDSDISLIPIVENKYMVNGAHRVGAALALGKNVLCRNSTNISDGQKDCSWLNCFKPMGMTEDISDIVAIEYAKLKSNTYVVTLFPSTKNNFQTPLQILNKHGKVIYFKPITLKYNGPLNLIRELYDGESWAGDYKNNYSGFRHKESLCFTSDNQTYAFLVEFNNYEDSVSAKKEIRDVFNIGNHSVHINDTYEQTLRLCKILFNKNSVTHLNNSNIEFYPKFERLLTKFKKLIQEYNLNIDDYCITASSVLSAYGLREGEDLDYIHLGNTILNDNENLIHSHNQYGFNLYEPNYEEIILNPKYHFFYKGVKFVSPEVIKNIKIKRNETKDVLDVNLINSIL
jgi:glycosyltransferase involved in cell wall biosynthesis